MGRKSKKVLELEEKIKELESAQSDLSDDDMNNIEESERLPIKYDITKDIYDDITIENEEDEDEDKMDTEEEIVPGTPDIQEEIHEIITPVIPPQDKQDKIEKYIIKNGYIFPFSASIIEKKKYKTYYIPRDDGVIMIYDIDRYDVSQLVYTAMYLKKRVSWVVVLMIVLFSLIFMGIILWGITAIFSPTAGENQQNNSQVFSDIGGGGTLFSESIDTLPPPTESNTSGPPTIIPPSHDTYNPPVESYTETAPTIIPSRWDEQQYGIIESYDHIDTTLSTVCPPDNTEQYRADISALTVQNNTLSDRVGSLTREIEKIQNENKELRGDGFSCWLGVHLEKKCSNQKNNEICKQLYYNYRIYEQ